MSKNTGNMALNGMVVTPHHLASQSAVDILREGGTAMEAAVAAAATIAVVYPHMNSIGGDGFWLIVPPHEDPIVIEACGGAGSLAIGDFFKGHDKIPSRGPKSAITVAGAVGGWQEALNYVSECGFQRLPISRLLSNAIRYAGDGFPVTEFQINCLKEILDEPYSNEFGQVFLPDGKVPKLGEIFRQKNLANTLSDLVEYGLDSFYRGRLAEKITSDMGSLDMPITSTDLANYIPIRKQPLRLRHKSGEIFNTPPPTQGLASLSILGILDKLSIKGEHEGTFIHAAVEATKQAFELRDTYVTDPRYMRVDPQMLLTDSSINKMANKINLAKASCTKSSGGQGDTVWIGVMDKKGFSVSYIQSIYYGFGSTVVLPKTGILWQNRGVSFSLDPNYIRAIKPGKKPFHTLNPAAAKLHDGRTIVYGTMGGDGQPQTQAAIFHRYVVQGVGLQKSVSAPRWTVGSTLGNEALKDVSIEGRIDNDTVNDLKEKGHRVIIMPDYCDKMGHAGMIVRHTNGVLEGAYDPRSDGSASGF